MQNFLLNVFIFLFCTESQVLRTQVRLSWVEKRIALQLTGKILLKVTSAQVCFYNTAVSV